MVVVSAVMEEGLEVCVDSSGARGIVSRAGGAEDATPDVVLVQGIGERELGCRAVRCAEGGQHISKAIVPGLAIYFGLDTY